MQKKSALVMVDLQNDFCRGGSLAVPGGESVVPLANRLQPCFDLIIATQDWHPHDHTSFASNHEGAAIGDVIFIEGSAQVLWPNHCVQGSKGAEFHPHLDTSHIHAVFHKGIEKDIDSYSAFFDNAHHRSTGLGDYLLRQHVSEIYILGLAMDYCVKYSSLDARQLGFRVFVIEDACRGVELKPGDIARAVQEMSAVGVTLVQSQSIFDGALLTKTG